MEFKDRYVKMYQTIMNEHMAVFEKQDLAELVECVEVIKSADRIFMIGVGREGIAGRSFAMRLMHLGKQVHWIWDDTTPGVQNQDLFISISGSGRIGHIHYVTERAKSNGATVLMVTGSPDGKTSQLADHILFVPASVYNGTDKRVVPSIQPMGNLFEQHLFILFDLLIMILEQDLSIKHQEMEARHRNVE